MSCQTAANVISGWNTSGNGVASWAFREALFWPLKSEACVELVSWCLSQPVDLSLSLFFRKEVFQKGICKLKLAGNETSKISAREMKVGLRFVG